MCDLHDGEHLGKRKRDCSGSAQSGRKINELAAIPELLGILALSSCIVTIDAIETRSHIAQTIVEARAEYV